MRLVLYLCTFSKADWAWLVKSQHSGARLAIRCRMILIVLSLPTANFLDVQLRMLHELSGLHSNCNQSFRPPHLQGLHRETIHHPWHRWCRWLKVNLWAHQQKLFPSRRNGTVHVDALCPSHPRHLGGRLLCARHRYLESCCILTSDHSFTIISCFVHHLLYLNTLALWRTATINWNEFIR